MSETNAKTPVQKPVPRQKPKPAAILLGLFSLVGLPLSLFLSAGTWNWPAAWIYIGLTLSATLVSRLIMAARHPDLVRERANSLSADNVQSWDKWIMPYVAVFGPLFVFIVAGLDERFGWTADMPLWLGLLGIALIVAGTALATWAMSVNRYFSGTVRIQTERGHQVVQAGPYRVIRHPGYLGGIVSYLGIPLVLGSVWAFIPAVIGIAVTILRTYLEDQTLQRELSGYAEFTRVTRFRLLPGVW